MTDPADGSIVHGDVLGVVDGVAVRAVAADGAARVQLDVDGLVDLEPWDAVRLAAQLLAAATRFGGASIR